MAQNEQDLDLDIDSSAGSGGGAWKKIALGALIVILLVAVSITTTLLLLGGSNGDSNTPDQAGEEEAAAAAEDSGTHKTPHYLSLDPPFVVNLNDDSAVRFLQVKVSVMAYSPESLEQVKAHMPMLRHHLVLLFSSQKFAEIRTREGKQRLQKEAREVVRQALSEATGKPLVEQVFLPSIVGQ